MKKLIIIIFMLICSVVYACEFGKTYKDFYGKPTEIEKEYMSNLISGKAIYKDPGRPSYKELLTFDNNGRIEKFTHYTWYGNLDPSPKDREPYVLYKGHRWYPQYHGIIYVYKDGREVK